jgi:hypothetical protein
MTSPPSQPLGEMGRDRGMPSTPALTRADTPHWPCKDRGDSSPLSPVKHHPCAMQREQDNTVERRRLVRQPTVQTRPDKTDVRLHPLWDGARWRPWLLRPTKPTRPWPGAQDRGRRLHKRQDDQRPRAATNSSTMPREIRRRWRRPRQDHVMQDGWRNTTVPTVPPQSA